MPVVRKAPVQAPFIPLLAEQIMENSSRIHEAVVGTLLDVTTRMLENPENRFFLAKVEEPAGHFSWNLVDAVKRRVMVFDSNGHFEGRGHLLGATKSMVPEDFAIGKLAMQDGEKLSKGVSEIPIDREEGERSRIVSLFIRGPVDSSIKGDSLFDMPLKHLYAKVSGNITRFCYLPDDKFNDQALEQIMERDVTDPRKIRGVFQYVEQNGGIVKSTERPAGTSAKGRSPTGWTKV